MHGCILDQPRSKGQPLGHNVVVVGGYVNNQQHGRTVVFRDGIINVQQPFGHFRSTEAVRQRVQHDGVVGGDGILNCAKQTISIDWNAIGTWAARAPEHRHVHGGV